MKKTSLKKPNLSIIAKFAETSIGNVKKALTEEGYLKNPEIEERIQSAISLAPS